MMIKEVLRPTLSDDRCSLSEVESSLKSALDSSNFPAALLHLRTLLRLLRAHPDSPEAVWTRLVDLFRVMLSLAKTQPNIAIALKETCLLADLFPTAKSAVVSSEAYDALGCALIQTQDFELAAKSLHKAVSAAMSLTDPGFNRATHYLHLCEAYFHLGKYKQAVRYGAQAAIYAEQMLETQLTEALFYDLRAIYSLLTKSEEVLKRFDRARYWQKRSQFFFTSRPETAESPVIRNNSRTKPEFSHSVPVSAAQSPRGSVNNTIKREQAEVQETSCLPDVTQKEGCRMWPRNSVRCGSVDDLKPLLRRADYKKPNTPKPSETPEPHEVTVVKPPRAHILLTDPYTPSTLLYQCWKKLKSGTFAHIRVGECPSDVWVIDLKCSDGSRAIEEKLGPHHAWRRLTPQALASLLQVGPKGELTLSGDTFRIAKTHRVELHREKREFDGVVYQIVYRTEASLKEVEIKAVCAGKRLRKTVVNDIELTSQQDTAAYIRDVLSPRIRITDDQIVVVSTPVLGASIAQKSRLAPLTPGQFLTDNSPKPVQSSRSAKRPSRTQDTLMASKSESPPSGRATPQKDEEKVYYIPDDVNTSPKKEDESKIVIRISEAQNATKEYQRDYQYLNIPRRASIRHLLPTPDPDTSPKLDRNSLFERLRKAKEACGSPLSVKRRSFGL